MACEINSANVRQGIINTARKELGVSPTTEDISRVNDLFKEELVKPKKSAEDTKEGVPFVFKQSPELSSIGTGEEYSQYLDSIFPDSKVKDILYHGSTNPRREYKGNIYTSADELLTDYEDFNVEEYENLPVHKLNKFENRPTMHKIATGSSSHLGTGIYFSKNRVKTEENYSRGLLYSVVINAKNPYTENTGKLSNTRGGKTNQELIDKGFDANTETDYVAVFDADQIHILGNKEDIEGFKNWKQFPYIIDPSEELINSYLENNKEIEASSSLGGVDPLIREKFFGEGDITTAESVLQKIANSKHPLSGLATKMLNYSHIVNSSITLVPQEKIVINNSGQEGFEASAVHRANGSIEMAEFASYKGLGSENTFLHEILHSYTVNFIKSSPNHPLVQQLEKVLEHLKTNQKSISDQYGLTNTKELVAEFFTSGNFVKDLQKLPSQNKFSNYKNLWSEVLDYILSLFKASRKEKSLYEEIFPFMTNVVEEGVNFEQAMEDLLKDSVDYRDYNEQQDEILSTYPEALVYSEDLEGMREITQEINDSYSEVFSQVEGDFNGYSHYRIEPFSKKALPDEFARRTIDGNLHPNEVANITNEILIKKLSKVFPKMTITEVAQQDLRQEDHLLPISDINSFVKGNIIYLVKDKFNTDSTIEEMLHPFTMSLYHGNKSLFDNIYEQEKGNYKKVEDYYSKFNKEDAKLEVVTQALRDAIKSTKPEKKTYLQQFTNFLKRVFSSLFPTQPNSINSKSSIGDIANLILNSGYKFSTYLSNKPYYSASEDGQRQLNYFNSIKNFAPNNGITKIGTDEGYVDAKGNKVIRVTEEIDERGDKNNRNPFTPEQKAFYEKGKEYGIAFHAIYDDVLSRHIDKDSGLMRAPEDVIKTKNLNGMTETLYNKLEKAMLERLKTYPTGTRFIWEVVGYNPSYKGKGLAGTQDFIAVTPQGKIHLLDWKFLNSFEKENIPKWKKDNYEFQLHNYVEMLKLATGASEEDFEKVRIIPHIVSLNKDLSLKELQTPTLDLTKDADKNRRLLPYISSAEYIEDTEIKFFLEKIAKIPEFLAKQEQVLTGSGKVDKDVEDLIQNAINDFMLLGNLKSLYQIHKNLADDITTLIDSIKADTNQDTIDPLNSDAINKKKEVIYELTQATKDFLKAAEFIYGRNLEKDINPGTVESKFKDDIRALSERMNNLSKDFSTLEREILDKYARYEGITDILKEEKKVTSFNRNFTFASAPETRSAAFFSSLMAKVWPKVQKLVNDGYIALTNLTHNVIKEQNAKGKSTEDIINMLTDVNDKGNFNGKLKTRYLPEFYSDKQEALSSKDLAAVKKFYEKWYDLPAYRTWLVGYLKDKHDAIDAEAIDDKEKRRKKKALEYYYDIDKSIQAYDKVFDNKYLIHSQDFKDKYYTEFYKDLEKPENLALKEFHDHIISINQKAADHNFIDPSKIYSFIPNIAKGFIERGKDNFNPKKIWKTFKDRFQVVPDSGLYGNVDPITMQLDKSVFVPYVYDRFKGDYSSKSKDVFRSFAIFNEELEKAIAMKNLAPIADPLLRMEQAKKVIPISSTGEKLWKRGQKGIDSTPIEDDANAKYLQMFIDWNVYGRKIQESIDKRITMADGTTYSLAKFLEGGMGWMYMNAFALNFLTPARAYVSAKASTYFLKGKDFNAKSLLGFDTFLNGLQTRKNDKMTALVGYFLPLINNQFQKKADELSVSKLTAWTTSDNLMYFFEKGDRMTQLETTYALLKNTIVIDGKLQNANRYVRSLPEFENIYNLPKKERKEAEKEIDRQIDEILRTNGILQTSSVDSDGNLYIPNLNNKEEAVNYFSNLVQSYTQKTTGQTLPWDTIGYKTSLLGRIVGQYRSWIPRTVGARLGKTKYNVQSQDYQWGRWIDFADATLRTFKDSWYKTANTVLGFTSQDTLIDYAKKEYVQVRSRVKKDGRQFTKDFISEKDYIEQYLNNINNTVNELRTIMGITVLLMSGLLAGGDGDDDKTKSAKSFARYQVSRLLSEFTFYINPFSFTDLFNKAIPMVSFIENFATLIKQIVKEFGGIILDDQMKVKQAHPLKAAMRTLPVFSEFSKFIPLISPELGKEMGIKPITSTTFF